MVAFARVNANSNVSGIVYHELTRQTENEHEINEDLSRARQQWIALVTPVILSHSDPARRQY
jgi:hypothetical protein